MKIRLLFAIGMLSSLTCLCATRADSIRAKMLDPNNKEVLVAVHRGDWRNYAENSLEGIDNAIKMGADIIEIDLRRTADGHLILMHDSSINRTTTGKGNVSELTLDSIRNVYLRSGVGEKSPYLVPTLEEALHLVKGRVLVNVDKAFDYFDQVFELIEKTGTTSQIVMKGGADASVVKEKYGKYLDKVIYMPVVNLDKKGAIDKIKDYMKVLNSPAYELVYRDSANTVIYEAKEVLYGKSRIWYNTLWGTLAGGRDDFASLKNPADGYGFLIDSVGATMLQTDQPAYLLGYLYDRKLKGFNCDTMVFKRYRKVVLDGEKKKDMKKDWANFGRYAAKNDALHAASVRPDVVFMGNSITNNWTNQRPEFFKANNIVGRGIGGQVSSQMLVRFQSDVIDLHPKAVVILAGTNDIAKNNGEISLEHILLNIKSMCQLAKANGINPIVASVVPTSCYQWRPEVKPVEEIRRFNAMLQQYAKANKIEYVDYYSAMANEECGLSKELSKDGVHPTDAGYEIMECVVMKTISKYLKK